MIDNYNLNQNPLQPNAINPNQLQPNAINPNAMGNMQTLQGLNGMQIPNTFNRTVGAPLADVNAPIQYSMPNTPVAASQNTIATGQVTAPVTAPTPAPQNVKTKIMANNNLQTY